MRALWIALLSQLDEEAVAAAIRELPDHDLVELARRGIGAGTDGEAAEEPPAPKAKRPRRPRAKAAAEPADKPDRSRIAASVARVTSRPANWSLRRARASRWWADAGETSGRDSVLDALKVAGGEGCRALAEDGLVYQSGSTNAARRYAT